MSDVESQENWDEPLERQGVVEAFSITPATRRYIILALTVIALVGIAAEIALILLGKTTSEALLTIVATAVGGIAGLAVPGSD